MRQQNSSIELASRISKDFNGDYKDYLSEINLLRIFTPIYLLGFSPPTCNTIIAFIIFAYDKDSPKLDVRRDRIEDKKNIIDGLNSDYDEQIYIPIIQGENKEVQDVYMKYLQMQKDSRFRTILTCQEFYNNNILFINEDTVGLTDDKIAAVRKNKAALLNEIIRLEKMSNDLILEVKKDYNIIDHITESELGFTYSNPENYDIECWADHIRKRNDLKERAMQR